MAQRTRPRNAPRPARAGLLDLWPRGRADAVPGRRPPPARVAATSNAPHPRLVRLHDGVSPNAGRLGLVAPGADLGAGSDREPTPTLRTRRASLSHMPIQRLVGPTMAVPLTDSDQVMYELELSTAPSPAWRTAFLRPSPALVTAMLWLKFYDGDGKPVRMSAETASEDEAKKVLAIKIAARRQGGARRAEAGARQGRRPPGRPRERLHRQWPRARGDRARRGPATCGVRRAARPRADDGRPARVHRPASAGGGEPRGAEQRRR